MSGQAGTFGRCMAFTISVGLLVTLAATIAVGDDGRGVSATSANRDYGDAPEGVVAYPSSGIIGRFPTCVGIDPPGWIEHASSGKLYFGGKVDLESEGNGGDPIFSRGYDQDEGFGDGDAGLTGLRAYSIKTVGGSLVVYPLVITGLECMASVCSSGIWGVSLDMTVHNQLSQTAYVNVLMDWNQDGKWGGYSVCHDGNAPEHVLVNFPVPAGYNGLLSALQPPQFHTGPNAGYLWARFTLSDQPIRTPWTGDGVFADGETEDYLLALMPDAVPCTWNVGDPQKMHWPQLPDLYSTGLAVNLFSAPLADDFRCMGTGPITDIHFWGAFLNDVRPPLGPNALAFVLSIYSNLPADNQITWSRPGHLLWTKKIGSYTYDARLKSDLSAGSWYDPNTGYYTTADHRRTYQYDFCFNDDPNVFMQTFGEIYWLEIKVLPEANAAYTFGWTTTRQTLQWNDDSAWHRLNGGWLPMTYPNAHLYKNKPMDLAFIIGGQPALMDFGDAPDPPYPTVLASDGARHIVDGRTFLGHSVDAEKDGQPDATATGDDLTNVDDEDGVVFVGDLIPGQRATVQVTASTTGFLNAWIDFNGNGDWSDREDHVFIDTILTTGVNTLTFTVPADAQAGQTYSRWRFSTEQGLNYTGLAMDGEVEDCMVTIKSGAIPTPTVPVTEHLKWSQPAVEQDPRSITPSYCGWDEPAYVSKAGDAAAGTWKLVADDFRCVGSMPVSSVHWWGSYQNWKGAQAPRVTPQSWRIAFWSNVAADSRYAFSRPGSLLWLVTVPAGRVTQNYAGVEQAYPPTFAPTDTCFYYSLDLQSQEYFWQDSYLPSTTDSVFWISITAVYAGASAPDNLWGWQTRPQSWMDTAVKFDLKVTDLRIGTAADPTAMAVLTPSGPCQQSDTFDMAFELNTDPTYIKAEQAFTGLGDWPHYEDVKSVAATATANTVKWTQNPDLTTTGIDVDATADLPQTWPSEIVADDFQCSATGPITRITVWGSWYRDILPSNDAQNVSFTLSIRQDVPVVQGQTRYSMPGKVLWQKQFARGAFTVRQDLAQTQSYYVPANSNYEFANRRSVYEYVFDIDPQQAFQQTGTADRPVVYWLNVQANIIQAAGSTATRFGWKTSPNHWNDSATWIGAAEPYSGAGWQQLLYPSAHPYASRSIDLAFEIDTQKAGDGLAYQQIVADDWQCASDTPVTGIVWWGSYIGYRYQACSCTRDALVATSPHRPDYFLLSIWTNVPDPDPTNSRDFSHPGQKIWEFKATDFDEVMVGFDKHPESGETSGVGFEPVYRYTVQLPQTNYFTQKSANGVYWLSIAAVYQDSKSMNYPWGWTNHEHAPWSGPTSGMLARWKLDESGGTTAADSSGSGNDGMLFGNAVWQPAGGRIAGALDCDGRSAYVKVAQANNLNFAPASFSVSTWVNPREAGGRLQALVEYDRFGGNRFGMWIDANGRFQFRVGSTTWSSVQSLRGGTWCLLTGVYDSTTRQMSLYINGQLDRTGALTSGYSSPSSTKLTLGVRGSEDGEYFNGLLDDVRIYGTGLAAADVMSLYTAVNNANAVMGVPDTTASTWQWVELFDQTAASEDLSFMLFTQPPSAKPDDAEIMFYP
jgi:hypothetical protein